MAIECKHGQLARSCNICALEAELAEVTAQRDKLQELINAPEVEPVARVTGYYAGYLSIETVDGRVLSTGTALYTAPPAPSVPDEWWSAIAKEFPLYDEDGLDKDKHCCEWVMLQERKRLHKMLAEAVAAEREACAKICESVWDAWDAANEIRARGEKGQT